QQHAVAAAHVEHFRARPDQVSDDFEIDARRTVHAHLLRPLARAADVRKPSMAAKNSGSWSRKASWPRSVSISTKDTEAPAAFSACTTARFSSVGNSQSLVKETRQKRVSVPRNASASRPPWSTARSK